MSRPSQFSMRSVFALALLVCVGAPLVKILVEISEQDGAVITAFFIARGAVGGAVCFSFAGRPVTGALGGV